MANNLIQIKRSLTTALPGSLANGELAYTANGDVLYIGSNGSVVAIGGKRVPGTLTANQALVSNSTSGIDKVIVANLVPTNVWANGAAGVAGQVLSSNSSGGVYWATPTSGVAGSDTQVQFNDGGSLAGDAGLTYNKTTDTLTVSNNVLAGGLVNAVSHTAGNNLTLNSTSLAWTGNTTTSPTITLANTGAFTIGNSTTTQTGSLISFANSVGNVQITPVSIRVGNSSVATFTANSTQVTIAAGVPLSANGGVGAQGQALFSNGATGSPYWGAVGDITSVAAGNGLTGGGTTGDVTLDVAAGNGISVSADAVAVSVGASGGLVANTTGLFVQAANGISLTAGGVNVLAGTNGGLVSNSTGVFVTAGSGLLTNSTGLHVGTGNGTAVDADSIRVVAGTDGGLVSNSSGVFVTAGSGLLTNSTGLHVGSGNGISVSADALAVTGGSTLTVNSTGVHVNSALSIGSLSTTGDLTVNGNTKLGDTTADVVSFIGYVNTSILPSANVTYDLGTEPLSWSNVHANNIHAQFGFFDKDVTIAGNLTVTGSLVTINVSTLSVTDSLIQLATNNTSTDTIDIGFYGNYNVGAGLHEHTGLFRDATDGLYKLFEGLQEPPTTTVDTSNTTFSISRLQTFLVSGGLTTNSTSANLIANSTYTVGIVANTLTLSSPLVGTSGGTGLNTYTAEDILVANSSNGFRKLSLGTNGYVLQSNGSALVYDTLDGGTF